MALSKLAGVYVLLHVPSGFYYVGSSGNFIKRYYEHSNKLKRGTHEIDKLQKLYDQEPAIKVSYFLITDDRESALNLEQEMLQELKDDPLLLNKTQQARILNMSGKNNHMFGRIVGDEERQRLSEQNRQYRHTEEAKLKIAAARIGKPLSVEHRKNISQTRVTPVSIDGVVYPSCQAAAEALNISPITVQAYTRSPKPQHSTWIRLPKDSSAVVKE